MADLNVNVGLAPTPMTGDSGSGGSGGGVPAPGAGDAAAGKFLKADATWSTPTASEVGADAAGSAAAAQAASQPLDSDLTSIAALSTASYGRSFLTLADAAAAKVYLGGVEVRTYTGTTDTLVLADAGNMVRGNNAAANTCTIPPNASVAFPVGTQILFSQYGAGQMTIVAGAGVTVNSYGAALKLVGRYAQAMVTKVGTNEWSIDGNLTA